MGEGPIPSTRVNEQGQVMYLLEGGGGGGGGGGRGGREGGGSYDCMGVRLCCWHDDERGKEEKWLSSRSSPPARSVCFIKTTVRRLRGEKK